MPVAAPIRTFVDFFFFCLFVASNASMMSAKP